MVKIGDRHLHVCLTGEVLSGTGTPTIILESGMGGCALDWALVQPELSKYAAVLSYDRAGFGWSQETLPISTCWHYVYDLRELLQTLGLRPPYLLVGHSYGGMMMRLFASYYPNEVQGLVLVDSTHEGRYLDGSTSKARKKEQAGYRKLMRLGYLLSPIGIPRMLRRSIGSKRLPPNVQHIVTALGYRSHAYTAAYAEQLGTEQSARQLKFSQPLPPELPVVVLTAGKQNESWKKGQAFLLQLTRQTTQIIVEDSWHSIQIHKPQAVIDAVRGLLDHKRNGVL